MKTGTVETLTWVFIYGGLLLLSLGLFVRRASAGLGLAFVALGGVLAVAGVVLVVVRSRMDEPPER